MLPALLSSGVGALVFTGLGSWTSLPTGEVALNLSAPLPTLDVADIFWSVPIAVAIAAILHPVITGARLIAAFVGARPFGRTVLCTLGAAACAALYALIAGRSPADIASSGQAILVEMAANPHAWGVGALFAVLQFKGDWHSAGRPRVPRAFPWGRGWGLACSPARPRHRTCHSSEYGGGNG